MNRFFDFIKLNFGDTLLYHILIGIIVFILYYIVALGIKIFLDRVDKKFLFSSNSKFRGTLYSIFKKNIVPIFSIFGSYYAIDIVIEGLAKKNVISRQILTNLHHLIFILIVFLLVKVGIKISRILLEYSFQNSAKRHNEIIDQSKLTSFNRIFSILIYTIGISIILKYFGQSIASVLALLGVGSIAIGLAAQDTISNMIAGFVIMFDRPFKVGNRIKLPTGEEGDIFEIGIRSTKILDFDHNLVVIPNAELIKTKIVNLSAPDESMRVFVDFTVPFNSDIEKVKKICIEIMKNEKQLDKSILPDVWLIDLKGLGLHFRAFCRTESYKNSYAMSESIKIKIHNELMKNNIDILPMDKNVVVTLPTKK